MVPAPFFQGLNVAEGAPVDWNLTDYLWFAASLGVLLVCLPMLLGMLGCTRFGARAIATPEAYTADGGGEEYRFYHRQLQALGFEPLGLIEERGYFLGFHYVKRFRYRVFVHHELGVYASVYRLFPGDEFRVALSTLLTDGWLVQTGCMESPSRSGEKYCSRGITTRVVAEQLQSHLDWLRSAWEKGDTLAPIDLGVCAARKREVNQARAGRWFSREAVEPLVLALIVLGSLAALGWLFPAWRHLLVPVGLLIGSLGYRPLMTFLLRWAAQGMRREAVDQEQQRQPVAGAERWSGSEILSGSVNIQARPGQVIEGLTDRGKTSWF
jgi:hypothetical protein